MLEAMRVTRAGKTTAVKANMRIAHQTALSDFCKSEGFVQADLLGRLLDWFFDLDPTFRMVVAGYLDRQDYAAIARIVLDRMAHEDEAGGSTPLSGDAARAKADAARAKAAGRQAQSQKLPDTQQNTG